MMLFLFFNFILLTFFVFSSLLHDIYRSILNDPDSLSNSISEVDDRSQGHSNQKKKLEDEFFSNFLKSKTLAHLAEFIPYNSEFPEVKVRRFYKVLHGPRSELKKKNIERGAYLVCDES